MAASLRLMNDYMRLRLLKARLFD